MKLVSYISGKQIENIERLYMEAFPCEERKPFDVMLEKCGEGVEMVAIEDDCGDFLGLAIMLVCGNIALLDYFAIESEKRGNNVGSRALQMLKERYADRILLIEIEDTDEESDNLADRIRRKSFYLRNGMVEQSYKVWFYGTKMQVMTGGDDVTFDDHIAVYRKVLGKEVSDNITIA